MSIHAQEKSIDLDEKHEVDEVDNNKDQLLKEYSWLEDLIDQKDCDGQQVSVYKNSENGSKFVFISHGDKRVMYDLSGKVYCTDYEGLDCLKFYKLVNTDVTWTCVTE